jgi:predicted dehydrogenase/threonine dehydrogenase-like Zn-dependent dehydrogenase
VKQVLESLRDGSIELLDIPCPVARPHHVLIATRRSVISAGTERMLLEFGRAGWIGKARQQPEKFRLVLDKLRTDGLLTTIEAVRGKLDQPITPGYANSGVVLETGPGVHHLKPGDRVASNGPHAELVQVPATLCARIPDTVPDEQAAFTVLGAIGLEGLRLAAPTLGECFAVTGLGLLGLLAVQLLRAHGCRVVGFDYDPRRLDLARTFGATAINLGSEGSPLAAVQEFTHGRGLDGVLITAATTSNEPMRQAAAWCRKRGRIVLVGVTGLQLQRADFYDKELSFQVSCSYGPGRYDPNYEAHGQDYPLAHARWTAQRNFEAVLGLMAENRLQVTPLITHRLPLTAIERAYAILGGAEPHLAVVLEYPDTPGAVHRPHRRELAHAPAAARTPVVGLIGAGAYAVKELLPALAQGGARLKTVVARGGISATLAGRRFGFEAVSTRVEDILDDPEVTTVFIATHHDSHATLAARALATGKHVWVEKPLATTPRGLAEISQALAEAEGRALLMTGFNRRFAPHVVRMKQLLDALDGPRSILITVNAGQLDAAHWAQDPELGGGRLIGEACHFLDLARHLAGQPVESCKVLASDPAPGRMAETATVLLGFAGGSSATVHYLANGHRSYPKERVEVFAQGRILVLDNFRRLRGYGWPKFRRLRLWRQDKGSRAAVLAFLDAIRSGRPSPIPPDQLLEVARLTVEAFTSPATKE